MTRHTFFCIDGHTCGNPGAGRRPAARSRALEGATMFERRQHFLSRARLDPHRADVRAARPRHDVGLDPLPADARRLRRRHPVHRDLGLPADVRPRHHRHGDDRARERARPAEDPGRAAGSTRRPASSRRATRRTANSSTRVRITNVPSFLYGEDYEVEVEGLGTLKRRRRLWRQFLRHRRAAGTLFATSPT